MVSNQGAVAGEFEPEGSSPTLGRNSEQRHVLTQAFEGIFVSILQPQIEPSREIAHCARHQYLTILDPGSDAGCDVNRDAANVSALHLDLVCMDTARTSEEERGATCPS
jgi:hypothetical protein